MMKRSLAAAGLLLGLTGMGVAADLPSKTKVADVVKETPFFLFADTQLSYRYQFPAAEPGVQQVKPSGKVVNQAIPKNIFNISHADAWAFGTNFFSVDFLLSGNQDPAGRTNGAGVPTFSSDGALEIYGLYRGTLSLNALTGTKAFAVPGFVKDVSLAFGFDANTKNTAFGPRKKDVVGGLNFAFDVPTGFVNLTVNAYKEWNRNGFNTFPNRDTEFDVVPEFELVYNLPLPFTSLPLSLAGFNNIVLPKGRGISDPTAFGANPKTGLEFLSRTNLVLDLGKLAWDQPNKVDVFIGFQYWHNKFGNVETATFKGTEEKSFLAGISFHVF